MKRILADADQAPARPAAAAASRESEARFRALFEQAAVGVAEVDTATGRFLRVNLKCCEITGYPEGELIGMDVRAMTHPADVAPDLTQLEHLGRGELRELSTEKRCVRKDGAVVWVNLAVSPLQAAGEAPGRLMVVVQDVTARRQAEAELARREEFLRLSQEVAQVGSWDWDVAGNRIRWSDEMCRLHGQDPRTFVPTLESALAFYEPGDRARLVAGIEASMKGGAGEPGEFRVVLPDGRVRTLWVAWRTYFGADGSPARVVGANLDITGRKERDERYRLLFTAAIEGIYSTGLDGTILDVNPAFARLLGHESPETLAGMNIGAFYADPEDRRRIQERNAGRDVVTGVEVRWRKATGELLSVEIHGRVVRAEDGAPSHYQGFVRDVTAQQQHEAALRVLSTGLSRLSGKAFFEEVAAQLAAIVGAEIGFVGTLLPGPRPRIRTLGFAIDGEAVAPVEYALRGTPCERVVTAGTAVFPSGVQALFPGDRDLASLGADAYAAVPLLDAKGAVIGHAGVMARRTMLDPDRVVAILKLFALRAAAEVERQRAEERFAGVFEFAPDAIVIVDEAGHIVLANRMAAKMLGYTGEELLRLTVEDLVPAAKRSAHVGMRAHYLAAPVSRRMGSARSRLWALRKDGTNVPVEISLSPFEAQEGRLIVAAIRDLTERVSVEKERARLEEQLRQAQKMESIGTLAGGIAHDFNNLLAAIAANLELARSEAVPGAPIAESLDDIAAAASRARDLVKQILTFSRRQPSSRSVTSLRLVVDEVARLLRATLPAGIQIVTDLGEEAPSALVDSTQLHQVLMNLGTNAWHAIERPTGRIALRLDGVSIGSGSPPAAGVGAGRYARIQVSDDGKGMDAATLERIFEPFFTTKEIGKGTGLGLAVAHGIVADHGGAITVDSVLDRGTTFSVYLPEARGESRPQERRQRPARGGAGHVLLIDDQELMVRSSRRLIERLGYQVTGFVRPSEALAAVRADPRRFDVVITDQNMPEMSGMEVARAIAELRPDLPIVLMSGNWVHTDDELAGANVHYRLEKPYTGAALSQVIERALKRS